MYSINACRLSMNLKRDQEQPWRSLVVAGGGGIRRLFRWRPNALPRTACRRDGPQLTDADADMWSRVLGR